MLDINFKIILYNFVNNKNYFKYHKFLFYKIL